METEERGLEKEVEINLQNWQEQVLAMESSELDDYIFGVKESTFLKKKQKEMIEYCLSDDYFILRGEDREILRKVLKRGYYYDWEKEVLNWIRAEYLKGKNFIKGNEEV